MHQIVCRLGLRRRPHWASLQRSPNPLAGLGVGPPGKGKEGGEKREGGREGKGGYGRERGKSRIALIHSWQAYTEADPERRLGQTCDAIIIFCACQGTDVK